MKKIYIKIDQMTCDYCKQKISESLLKIKNVSKLSFDGTIAELEYTNNIDKDKLIYNIISLGYFTSLKMISENKKKLKRKISLTEFIIIFITFAIIAFTLNKTLGFNIFNMIPVINSNITYTMLFITGILTSIHCISMCGAINLIASSSNEKNFKKPIYYNFGRLISYALIGGIVGLVGKALSINSYVEGTIIIIASIFMFLMALNMLGIINFNFKFKYNPIPKAKSSFFIGLLNGLMPCGPLQAMQIYALSTGSAFYGALSMFVFSLGTIPLMLFMGILSNILKFEHKRLLSKISTVLIVILSLAMLNRGLLNIGINISNIIKPSYESYLKSEIKEDYQYIEFDLSHNGYNDIVIQKGIPVKLVINVKKDLITGCNNAIKINAFDIESDLKIGENVIEFTPNKEGIFAYTCWMNMLKNNIVVIDDIKYFEG